MKRLLPKLALLAALGLVAAGCSSSDEPTPTDQSDKSIPKSSLKTPGEEGTSTEEEEVTPEEAEEAKAKAEAAEAAQRLKEEREKAAEENKKAAEEKAKKAAEKSGAKSKGKDKSGSATDPRAKSVKPSDPKKSTTTTKNGPKPNLPGGGSSGGGGGNTIQWQTNVPGAFSEPKGNAAALANKMAEGIYKSTLEGYQVPKGKEHLVKLAAQRYSNCYANIVAYAYSANELKLILEAGPESNYVVDPSKLDRYQPDLSVCLARMGSELSQNGIVYKS